MRCLISAEAIAQSRDRIGQQSWTGDTVSAVVYFGKGSARLSRKARLQLDRLVRSTLASGPDSPVLVIEFPAAGCFNPDPPPIWQRVRTVTNYLQRAKGMDRSRLIWMQSLKNEMIRAIRVRSAAGMGWSLIPPNDLPPPPPTLRRD